MARSEKDKLMARYATCPLGNGVHGVYDRSSGKYIATYSGRGAYRKALTDWHTLIKSGRVGMDRNAS